MRGPDVNFIPVGPTSLFVYLLPDIEANAAALGVVIGIWQGILLWKAEPGETQAPQINATHTIS